MPPQPQPADLRPFQYAKLALESYAQKHGKSGHYQVYLQHLRAAVAAACEAKMSILELRQQLAAAELAGIERRDLKALGVVVTGMGKMGIGFDTLREVREVTQLRERLGCMEGGQEG